MLVLGLLIARGQALWFPVYAALLLAPLTILLVAWDVERLVTLAGTTALMVCLAVEERCRIRQAPLYALAATLALASVGLTARYKEVNRFAYDGMLLGPERHRR